MIAIITNTCSTSNVPKTILSTFDVFTPMISPPYQLGNTVVPILLVSKLKLR